MPSFRKVLALKTPEELEKMDPKERKNMKPKSSKNTR